MAIDDIMAKSMTMCGNDNLINYNDDIIDNDDGNDINGVLMTVVMWRNVQWWWYYGNA